MKNLLILLVLIGFASCEVASNLDHVQSLSSNVTIPDDIPVYENLDHIIQSFDNASNSNARTEVNLNTFQSYYDLASDELEQATSENEFFSTIEKYGKIIYFDELDSLVKPYIVNPAYRKIVNSEGMYIMSDTIHKVIENKIVAYSHIEDYYSLSKINSISEVEEMGFRYFNIMISSQTIDQGRIDGNCGETLSASYVKNKSGCNKDRRVIISAETFMVGAGSGQNAPYVSMGISAYKKIFCAWSKYKTTIYSRDASYTINFNISGSYLTNETASGSWADTNFYDEKEVILFANLSGYADYPGSGTSVYNYFDAVSLKGGCRGTGSSNFAVINCQ